MINVLRGVLTSGAGLCRITIMLLTIILLPVGSHAIPPESGQQAFSTPEEAREALIVAARTKDQAAMKAIFGPVLKDLEPDDPVEQAAELDHFSRHMLEGSEIVAQGDEKAILAIGSEKWPFPVPIVKKGNSWWFDTEAGREEILSRRIGRNELHAINVCKAYVGAQREYYTMLEPDGDQLPKYAQRMFSSPGRKNGLYWATAAGEKESPLGPLIARAKEEGYMQDENGPRPFQGYIFHILNRQGPSAPGGKFSYIINGNMLAGHALVAYPTRWGVSGVMTFIVNQRGRVYQKNLGPKTTEIARKMKSYNPDTSWKLVEER